MVSWTRISYRVTQFVHTFAASFQSVDVVYVKQYLSPRLYKLFQEMSHVEQHHGIAVCQALEREGDQDKDLFIAALLHDVGKCVAPPRLWERVAVVLIEHYAPHLAVRWGRGEPRGLRRGFVTRRQHPQWGATMAAEAGASARVVELIQLHHAPFPNGAPLRNGVALMALQKMDDI